MDFLEYQIERDIWHDEKAQVIKKYVNINIRQPMALIIKRYDQQSILIYGVRVIEMIKQHIQLQYSVSNFSVLIANWLLSRFYFVCFSWRRMLRG